MSLDWYPWFLQPWRRQTRHLTLAEKGAYRELCDEYMASGEALPDNDRALASLVGCLLDEWLVVAPEVRKFFHAQNGRLIHKRCEQELSEQRIRAVSRSAQGKHAINERWRKHRELNSVRIPGVILNDTTIHKKDIKEVATDLSRLTASPSLLASIKAKGWTQ